MADSKDDIAQKRFRIAFSFAGEKREFVSEVAKILADRFDEDAILYDKFHEAEFARSDLAFYLPNLYERQSELIVAVFCPDYETKEWCGLEWNAIFGLLKEHRVSEVMLTRFDYIGGKGLRNLEGAVDLDHKTPEEAAKLILQRLALNEGKPKNYYIETAKPGSPQSPVGSARTTSPDTNIKTNSLPIARSSKVFISYAHGDRAFQDRVRAFADRLEVLGLETIFDQYESNPSQGWTKWMVDGVQRSDFVLCVCTQTYHDRVNEEQSPGTGLGVQWEGTSLYNLLQSEPEQRKKVQVVQFDTIDAAAIPLPIRGNGRYVISQSDLRDEQFEALYRVLTHQAIRPPARGNVVALSGDARQLGQELQVLPPTERLDAGEFNIPRIEMAQENPLANPTGNSEAGRVARRKLSGPGDTLQRLARQRLKEASKEAQNNRYEHAIALAEESLRLDGSSMEALFLKAYYLYLTERWTEAVEGFKEYEMRGGNLTEGQVIMKLTALYKTTREESLVLESVNIANKNKGDYISIIRVADLLYSAGKKEEARNWLAEALSRDVNPGLLCALAILEWRDGNNSKSSELLEEATRRQKSSQTFWANLGIARAEERRFGLAIEALRRAQAINPQAEFPIYALAEVYALMEDPEAAVELLKALSISRSHYLRRISTEKTFDPIRDTPLFRSFVREIEDQRSQSH